MRGRCEIAAEITVESGLWQQLAGEVLTGTVHSVFHNVINWREEKSGRLHCLTSSRVDCAYETIVTDLPSLEELEVSPGTPVILGAKLVRFGGEIQLVFRSVQSLRLELPPWPEEAGAVSKALADCEEYLQREGKRGGMLPLTPVGGQDPFAQATCRGLQLGRAAAEAAVRRGDRQAFRIAAQELLGLGQGLTPSGDDYLSGLLLTFHLPGGPLYHWADIGGQVAQLSAAYTTDMGVWEIQHAARGWVRENMAAFLRDLFAGDETYGINLQKILSIGSLSGTDLATGLLAGITLALEAATTK